MSEITEIRKDVSYIKGQLDSTLPMLARTDQVANMIASHKQSCRRSLIPPAPRNKADVAKLTAQIVAAIGVLTGAIWGLVEAIQTIFGQ